MAARYASGGILVLVPRLSSTRSLSQSGSRRALSATSARTSSAVDPVRTGPAMSRRACVRPESSLLASRTRMLGSVPPPRLFTVVTP